MNIIGNRGSVSPILYNTAHGSAQEVSQRTFKGKRIIIGLTPIPAVLSAALSTLPLLKPCQVWYKKLCIFLLAEYFLEKLLDWELNSHGKRTRIISSTEG